MERSSFNSYLFKKTKTTLVASITCVCGGFENPYHLFFICPRYAGTRILNYQIFLILTAEKNYSLERKLPQLMTK